MRHLLSALCLFAMVVGCGSALAEQGATTIYLIRHAEKDLQNKTDPELTAKGRQRAKQWAKFFASTKLDAVFSTDTIRTRDTATVVATSQQLPVSLYNASSIEASKFQQQNTGKTVLMVGHSNTIAEFTNALIGQSRYAELDESVYSAVFVVDLTDEIKAAKKLHVAFNQFPIGEQNMSNHEKINYLEYPAQDIEATKAFFEHAFDWAFTDYGPDYTAFSNQGIDGGFFRDTKAGTTENGSPLTVFYSDDLEATLKKVQDAGGKIIKPIFSFPGGRRFQFLEPSGNEFAVWGHESD